MALDPTGRPVTPRPATRPAFLGAVILFAFLLALPATAGSAPTLPAGPMLTAGLGAASFGPIVIAPAFEPGAGVQDLGPMGSSAPISLEVALATGSGDSLDAYATAVSTPGSPSYHQFLRPTDVASRFGASPDALARAADYFGQFGLVTTASPDHFFLRVTGPSAEVSRAFDTRFELYREGARTFYSHPLAASLPAGIPWAGAVGLGDASVVRPLASLLAGPLTSHVDAGCSATFDLPPCAIWNAYNISGLIAGGTNGTGERVAVVDAYDSVEPQSRLVSDFTNFTSNYALPSGGFTIAYPVPAGNTLNTTPTDGWADEEALDLEWIRASAPGDQITDALAANTNAALYGAVDWLVAQDQVSVISLSWGEPDVGVYNAALKPCPNQCNASADGSYGMLHPVLAAAAVEGITVLAASGDCGAADGTSGVSTNYPASDPWTLGVGGTALNTNATGAWTSETAWSGNASGASGSGCQNQGGSGGGYAPFPRPYWQVGTGLPARPASRGVPDVAIDAASAVPIVLQGGTFSVIGTSLSAPLWAGVITLADESARHRLGFVNPALYQILRNGSYARDFHDVTSGSNGYRTGTGWDPVTGLGTPIVSRLLGDLAGTAPTPGAFSVDLLANRTAGPLGASVSFRANATGGSGGVAFYDFVFGDGNATVSNLPTASHVYPVAGVFNATVVAVDAGSNSTVSAPQVLVIGGGATLGVALTSNTTRTPPGAPVQFQVSVSGGTAPYLIQFDFGDGTYSIPGSAMRATHVFHSAGGYCASATVMDAASPPDGALAGPISLAIGAATRPVCVSGPPRLNASLSANYTAADLPGDLPLAWNSSGGVGPLTAWLNAPDPYVERCQCGLFRTVGPENVTLQVNDSVGNRTARSLGVTIYPALVGTFRASSLSGPAPLHVTFGAQLTGGHLPDANRTLWRFGDGTNASGAQVNHTYATAGFYLATALVGDAGHGNASEAFLLDVTTGSGPVVTGSISPALETLVGAATTFRANVTGSPGTPTVLWNLSDGSSAFGGVANDTLNPAGCAVVRNCTISGTLTVGGAGGAPIVVPFSLGPFFSGRWSALSVAGVPGPRAGTTPLRWTASETGTGMPGAATSWGFGDGGSSVGTSADHVYLRPGNFTVMAILTDSGGDRTVRPEAVAMTGATIAPLTVALGSPPGACFTPCALTLQANASGGVPGVDNFTWSFGDGTESYGASVLHAYRAAGTFNLSVVVTDSFGENASARAVLRVANATPVTVALSASPGSVPAGHTFAVSVRVSAHCGRGTVANCSRLPVPIELDVRLHNASGPVLLGYPLAAIPSNASATFTLPAPALQGPFWLAAVAVGPNFTGEAVVGLSVGPPAPVVSPYAGAALLALGAFVGLASAAAVVLYERGRPRRFPPAALPGTSP